MVNKHIGKIPANKGLTAENCDAVRERAMKLKHRYAEGELQPSMNGKTHSVETLYKMSEVKRGELNPFYGKHHSTNSKLKISEKLCGHTTSNETRQKISLANKGSNNGMFGKESHNRGKICITNGVVNKYVINSELALWEEQGWYRGSTQRRKLKL